VGAGEVWLGVGVGVSLGVGLGEVGLGVGVGVSLGVGVGLVDVGVGVGLVYVGVGVGLVDVGVGVGVAVESCSGSHCWTITLAKRAVTVGEATVETTGCINGAADAATASPVDATRTPPVTMPTATGRTCA
jgi:hypothetical protein